MSEMLHLARKRNAWILTLSLLLIATEPSGVLRGMLSVANPCCTLDIMFYHVLLATEHPGTSPLLSPCHYRLRIFILLYIACLTTYIIS